ncbi:hypothetical protein BH747_04555 [Enterococcus villorum]|uniref:Uncharacterized protein n=1 Tax=Enterococcus villorum TaxID=112904 RepID=A0A1V8YV33_9ENTE|nr:hypothetical protein [Enterococcus villorum]OQO70678.1 hypothetical protein BH747_04555 [Enterococcus villorum]OQO76510.1 hypothetical protein BH744_02615 [Enterococcus villorum]
MKKYMTYFLVSMTLASVATPIVNVSATTGEADSFVSLKQQENELQLSLDELKKNPDVTVEVNGDDFTISFNDSTLYNVINSQQSFIFLKTPRAAGVTKIQGKLSSGNFKVYLSKNTLNAVQAVGGSAISWLLGGGWGFIGSSIYNIIRADRNFLHGRVFIYSGFRYQYWYYQ